MGRRDECGSSEGCPDSKGKTSIDGRADGAIPSDRPVSSNICSVVGALTGALVISSLSADRNLEEVCCKREFESLSSYKTQHVHVWEEVSFSTLPRFVSK